MQLSILLYLHKILEWIIVFALITTSLWAIVSVIRKKILNKIFYQSLYFFAGIGILLTLLDIILILQLEKGIPLHNSYRTFFLPSLAFIIPYVLPWGKTSHITLVGYFIAGIALAFELVVELQAGCSRFC